MSQSLSLWLLTNWRRAATLALTTTLLSCASSSGFNETTRINDLKAELLATSDMRKLVITHINLGAPSRNYVERAEPMIDGRVAAYLKANGYAVAPQREFSQRWENAKLVYGDPVDPTTGRVNRKTFAQLVTAVRDQMREQTCISSSRS